MTLATLTSKGQITVPKAVRDSLQIKTGDKIEFVVTESREVLMRPITMHVDDVFGRLHNNRRKPVSVEEMNAAVQTRMKRDFK
jgi:antitoxin PrlF